MFSPMPYAGAAAGCERRVVFHDTVTALRPRSIAPDGDFCARRSLESDSGSRKATGRILRRPDSSRLRSVVASATANRSA